MPAHPPGKVLRVFYGADPQREHTGRYYRAIEQFLAWCERGGYRDLEDIEPITVAAYIETLQRRAAPPNGQAFHPCMAR